MDDEPRPAPGTTLVSRRRLLAAGALAGTAVVLAACEAGLPVGTPASVGTHLPSGAPNPGSGAATSPGASLAVSPDPSAGSSPAPTPSGPPPSLPPDLDTSMKAENALKGDPRWDQAQRGGQGQAYLGAASVGPGEPLSLRARGSGTVSVEWYRMGWYGGAGARLLRTDRGVKLRSQPRPTTDPTTGLVEAGWDPVFQTTAPIGVNSGMLLAVLRDANGTAVANAPVVLRPDPTDARRAPILFVSAASTWQAYNQWGGTDLYGNYGHHPISVTQNHRAAQVSFDRPYYLDGGAGYLRRWELQFIRWAERSGRDIEYIADIDLERNPAFVTGRRLIIFCGHPEYWSRPMRTTIEAAVAQGTNVAFITSNEVYWQTRIEDGPAGPASRITSYKSRTADPITLTHPELTTCRWREAPVNDPEAPLVGQMYGAIVNRVADWIVTGSSHWLYEGTSLRDGEAIVNLVGQEFDTFFPDLAQPGTVLLANSPVDAKLRDPLDPGAAMNVHTHNATMYTAQSGATVFAAGTFQWSWALDDYGRRSYLGVRTPVDDRVARMTRNLFDRLGDGPLAP